MQTSILARLIFVQNVKDLLRWANRMTVKGKLHEKFFSTDRLLQQLVKKKEKIMENVLTIVFPWSKRIHGLLVLAGIGLLFIIGAALGNLPLALDNRNVLLGGMWSIEVMLLFISIGLIAISTMEFIPETIALLCMAITLILAITLIGGLGMWMYLGLIYPNLG